MPTPTVDKLAQRGLRYTEMHNTALCSPTRAALLTGRNHHAVGFGSVAEASTGYPGYDFITRPETAHGALALKENGYSTAWFGKNHNVPVWEAIPQGPFTHWPIGQGYDYFYGFVGGDTSQWQPGCLFRNTTSIHPYEGKPGWNLITAMADDCIEYITTQTSTDPKRPWFIHYAPGATHAPHHPTQEWMDKISAMHLFDDGWNAVSERIFENQKKLGVVPANAKLPPWPDFLPKWETLSADQKKLYLRQIDVWAAYMAYSRPRDRPHRRNPRKARPVRQHADRLRPRRQRHERRRLDERHAERSRLFQRLRLHRGADAAPDPGVGHRSHLPPLRGALGLRDGHALSLVQADRLASRRHAHRHGRNLAQAHQGRRRHPQPVPPRHRHHTDDLRCDRHPPADDGQRHRPAPVGRREHGLYLGQGQRRRAVDAQDAVFRDLRQSRDLPRRLDGQHHSGRDPVGRRQRASAGRRAERVQMGAVQPQGGSDPDERSRRPGARAAAAACRSSG